MKFFKKLSRSVKGRVAIITGAGSGMGEATAKVFAAEGVKVCLLYTSDAADDGYRV